MLFLLGALLGSLALNWLIIHTTRRSRPNAEGMAGSSDVLVMGLAGALFAFAAQRFLTTVDGDDLDYGVLMGAGLGALTGMVAMGLLLRRVDRSHPGSER